MRVYGYCESCTKVKPVTLNSSGMLALSIGRPITGVCQSCEEAARDRRLYRLSPR